MIKVDVFGKETCELCAHTKRKLDIVLDRWGFKDQVETSYWDLGTVEGLAEGTFNDVFKTPTVLVSRDGRHVARWEGEVFDSQQLKLCIDGGGTP